MTLQLVSLSLKRRVTLTGTSVDTNDCYPISTNTNKRPLDSLRKHQTALLVVSFLTISKLWQGDHRGPYYDLKLVAIASMWHWTNNKWFKPPSLKLASSPAPDSTLTVKPFLTSVAATVGVNETRRSPCQVSRGTPKASLERDIRKCSVTSAALKPSLLIICLLSLFCLKLHGYF